MRDERKSSWGWIHVVSILIALALHGMVLYVVASQFKTPVTQESAFTVVMHREKASPVSEFPSLRPHAQPAVNTPRNTLKSQHKSVHLQASPEISPSEQPPSPAPSMASAPLSVVPAPSETPAAESTPTPAGLDAGVAVGAELSFFCPVRPAPVYPQISRKLGEEGTVILHVEWDQKGQITFSRVETSSGFRRLDEAALTALNNWRCNPAKQDGVPVRAVAVQPFKFQLQKE